MFVCESTYLDDLKHKAVEYNHMTAKEAATIAKKSAVKELVITHFSGRYKEVSELEKEAQEIFKNTKAAEDFMKIRF